MDSEYYDEEKLPTPAKPSLKMRLFCDENKRQLLRSVFEEENAKPSTSNGGKSKNHDKENVWLGKSKNTTTAPKGKRPRVISIDDSF